MLSAFIFLFACKDRKTSLFEEIKAIEASEQIGTEEGLAKLAELHEEYGLTYKDSTANNFLYAAGTFHFHGKDKKKGVELLKIYLERDDSSVRARNSIFNIGFYEADNANYKEMNQYFSTGIKGFNPSPAQWNEMLKAYTVKIQNQREVVAWDYEQQALCYSALGLHSTAIEVLDTAIAKYPNNKRRPELIYKAGFTAWEYMQNVELARSYYEQFVKEYPNHDLAKEVQQILNSGMLDMSDEEILELFKSAEKK
jgi:TolA-binding protein